MIARQMITAHATRNAAKEEGELSILDSAAA
jgi:hypothetical protein